MTSEDGNGNEDEEPGCRDGGEDDRAGSDARDWHDANVHGENGEFREDRC